MLEQNSAKTNPLHSWYWIDFLVCCRHLCWHREWESYMSGTVQCSCSWVTLFISVFIGVLCSCNDLPLFTAYDGHYVHFINVFGEKWKCREEESTVSCTTSSLFKDLFTEYLQDWCIDDASEWFICVELLAQQLLLIALKAGWKQNLIYPCSMSPVSCIFSCVFFMAQLLVFSVHTVWFYGNSQKGKHLSIERLLCGFPSRICKWPLLTLRIFLSIIE